MPSAIRQNRFATMTPHDNSPSLHLRSLHRLKTAFSPTRSFRSLSQSSSTSSTGTTSPLTSSRGASPDSHRSRSSTNSSIRQLLILRRKPSVIEMEMEEERYLFADELSLLEPRPFMVGAGRERVEVGIFEVLEGRV